MNGLDIVILVAFFASTLIGAMRGFTKEILSLFSWGGAIALSYIFLPLGRSMVHPYIANPMMADGAALFCMFVIALILLSIIASIIAGYIQDSSFRGVDHSLGFGFGMLRGVVFISAAELMFSTFSPRHSQSSTFQHARFIPMARKGGDTLLQLLPCSLRATILEQAIKVENQVNSKVHDHLKNAAPTIFPDGIPKSGLESGLGHDSGQQGGHPGGHLSGQQGVYPGGVPSQGSVQGSVQDQGHSQGYDGRPQAYNYPPAGQPPSSNIPPQGPQGLVQPQAVMQPQGGQAQSGMVVIRPPQPGQAPQLGTAMDSGQAYGPQAGQPGGPQAGPQAGQLSGPQGAPTSSSPPPGLAQSAVQQDRQTTVDELARLRPQSSSKDKEESGYTRGQRDDMNRLFQAADGE